MSAYRHCERELGRVTGDGPGPMLIAVAAIHGNEHAGIDASRRVLELLSQRKARMNGDFVVFSGNLGALRKGCRFLTRDMNRGWTADRMVELESRGSSGQRLDTEDAEQLDLLRALRGAIKSARGGVFLIDLHTTSAQGVPFVLFGDTLRQRQFAGAFPLPLVMGLEEHVEGCLSSFMTTQGCITCAVEGGQHDDPGSVDNLEAVLLLGVESAGLLGPGLIAETANAHALLERRRGELPRVLEVVSRHAISPDDKFVMEPGFLNLARVSQGQLLAHDTSGPIHAKRNGFVMLPLYQGQGSDGFFWGREVTPARLRMSELLRHMNVDRFVHLLPGIARDPKCGCRLFVDEFASQVYGSELFHMLGYRRMRREPSRLTVERQPEPSGTS